VLIIITARRNAGEIRRIQPIEDVIVNHRITSSIITPPPKLIPFANEFAGGVFFYSRLRTIRRSSENHRRDEKGENNKRRYE